jgi:molybdopterin converting factor small subunit
MRSSLVRISVVVTGRSYHATGQLPREIDLPAGSRVDDALRLLGSHLGDDSLPPTCLVAVAGKHLGTLANHTPAALSDGDELTLIAPVAGG